MPTAVLLGTLDTKGREYGYVRDELRLSGVDVLLIDVGILAAPGIEPDVPADAVAAAAGSALQELRARGEGADARSHALDVMRRGATRIVSSLQAEGRCDGVLGMGGSGGSSLLSGVMRSLPFGLPKILVSTMASGDISSYVGVSDLCVLHSVTDIAGLNRISRAVLRNAAGALAGMVAARGRPDRAPQRPAVGVSMLGVTTPGALRIVERLDREGYDAVVFHAVGTGGRALEALTAAGEFAGLVDLTIKEVTDEVLGGVFATGPERLRTAGRLGVPRVVVPGAVEVINFGAVDTVPEAFRDGRPLVRHNDQVTAVRATPEELRRVADEVAARLNESPDRLEVLIPTTGFDSYAVEGGPFSAPDEDRRFIERFRERLDPRIPVDVVDADINDPAFADAVVERVLALMRTAESGSVSVGPA